MSKLRFRQANPNIIYAAYGMCSYSEVLWCKDPPVYDASPLFFVSQDGGASWLATVNNANIETYSRYTHALTADSQAEGKVYYGGLRLWSSNDYGNNFAEIPGSYLLHLDVQDFIIPDPNEPLIQYVATDGGFYIIDRRPGFSWIGPLNHGLETVQFYSACSSDWAGSQLLLGGYPG